MGRCPGVSSPEKRALWHRAYQAAGMPEERRPEAELSDGRLLVRVRAAQRVHDSAPAAVHDAQRERHQAVEAARREAILARAQGREADAARRDQEVAEHARAAARLDQIATARGMHLLANAETLHTGEAARDELVRRGLDPAARDDQVTATGYLDWMKAEHDAREQDDAHRAITEADLEDESVSSSTHTLGTTKAAGSTLTAEAETDQAGRVTHAAASRASTVKGVSAGAAAAEIQAAAAHAATTLDQLADQSSQDAAGTSAGDDEWHRRRIAIAEAEATSNSSGLGDAAGPE